MSWARCQILFYLLFFLYISSQETRGIKHRGGRLKFHSNRIAILHFLMFHFCLPLRGERDTHACQVILTRPTRKRLLGKHANLSRSLQPICVDLNKLIIYRSLCILCEFLDRRPGSIGISRGARMLMADTTCNTIADEPGSECV